MKKKSIRKTNKNKTTPIVHDSHARTSEVLADAEIMGQIIEGKKGVKSRDFEDVAKELDI